MEVLSTSNNSASICTCILNPPKVPSDLSKPMRCSIILCKFESSRTALLEQAVKIILATQATQDFQITIPMAWERLLPAAAVIQVPVPVTGAMLLRVSIDLPDRSAGYSLDLKIIDT